MERTDDRHQAPVPMLRGQYTWLRPSEPEDVERFVSWLSDAETSSFRCGTSGRPSRGPEAGT